jgi:prolipoprotein diacylglyceryl transferase
VFEALSIGHMSIPSPNPDYSYFTVGPFVIHYYALCIIAGIIAAAIWTSVRLSRRGGEPGVVLDVVLWAVPLGIVGARAWHVFTHPTDYFYAGADLWKVLFIWDGGDAIFGSMVGGAIGAIIACRIAGLRFFSFADALAPAMLLAQSMGRVGNYFNNELFGVPTNLPWGLQISSSNPAFPVGLPDGTLFIPLFLYEIVWNVIGIVVILLLERKFHLRWGKAIAVYFMWYGIGRSYLESIRIDPSEYTFFGIPFNVWAAFGLFVIGLIVFIVQSRRHPGLEISVYRPGREWVNPKAAVDSIDTDPEDEFDDEDVEDAKDSDDATATSPIGS